MLQCFHGETKVTRQACSKGSKFLYRCCLCRKEKEENKINRILKRESFMTCISGTKGSSVLSLRALE